MLNRRSSPPRRRIERLSRSEEDQSIDAHVFAGATSKTILVFGGFHGDEPKSVHVALRLIEYLSSSAGGKEPHRPGAARWVIVPVVNPDGYARRKRRNARGVDINRNFPTKDWVLGDRRSRMFGGKQPASERETRCVILAVERYRPRLIVSIHSIDRNRYCNNYNGPAARIARRMARHNKYPVTSSIGYPTPGSFGTWAGVERGIPLITLELPSHHSPKRCWGDNRDALSPCAEYVRRAR